MLKSDRKLDDKSNIWGLRTMETKVNYGSDRELIQYLISLAIKCGATQDDYEKKVFINEMEIVIKALKAEAL